MSEVLLSRSSLVSEIDLSEESHRECECTNVKAPQVEVPDAARAPWGSLTDVGSDNETPQRMRRGATVVKRPEWGRRGS